MSVARVFTSILAFNNNPSLLRVLQCLRAQTTQPSFTLIIDNGSTEPVSRYLSQHDISLRSDEEVLRLDNNCGVGAGHNLGLRRAQESGLEYVWLLEHDTYPYPECLDTLLSIIESAPDPALAAAQPCIARNHYEAELLGRGLDLPESLRPRRSGLRHEMTFNGLLMTMGLAERAGYLREDFVVGYEDYYYNRSLVALGASVLTSDKVLGIHPTRGAGRYPGPRSPHRDYFAARNAILVRREGNRRPPLSAWAVGARTLAGAARALLQGDSEVAGAKVRGVMAGLSGSDTKHHAQTH